MKVIRIYVDGGYNPSEQLGAYAFVVIYNKEVIHESVKCFNRKEYPSMTINKMEMHAVIVGINWIRSNKFKPAQDMFYVFTDSHYVQLGVNKWMKRRMSNSKNKGMWVDLDKLIQSFSEFSSLFIQWIPSDSEDKYHKRAHELCKISMTNILKK